MTLPDTLMLIATSARTAIVFAALVVGIRLTVNVRHREILPELLAKYKLTEEDVKAAVRKHGYESIRSVRYAILERDGSVGVIGDKNTKH